MCVPRTRCHGRKVVDRTVKKQRAGPRENRLSRRVARANVREGAVKAIRQRHNGNIGENPARQQRNQNKRKGNELHTTNAVVCELMSGTGRQAQWGTGGENERSNQREMQKAAANNKANTRKGGRGLRRTSGKYSCVVAKVTRRVQNSSNARCPEGR